MIFRALLALAFAASASAQTVVTFTWTGTASGHVTNGANWQGGVAPTVTSAAGALVFGPSNRTDIDVNFSLSAQSITFTGSYPHYYLGTSNNSPLNLGAGGVTVPASVANYVDFSYGLPLLLQADQTWNTGGNLSAYGAISGAYKITKTGAGALTLGAQSTFNGGLDVTAGTLILAASGMFNTSGILQAGPAGAGTVTLRAGTTLTNTLNAQLPNPVNLGSTVTLGTSGSHEDLTLLGAITLLSPSTTLIVLNDSATQFFGAIGETTAGSALTFTGGGLSILGGVNTYTGGTTVNAAGVTFFLTGSLPATGAITALNGAYLGVGYTGAAAIIIAKSTPSAYAGSLGLDTDPTAGSATTFTDVLNFSSFDPAKFSGLGSQTRAIFSGTLTPVGTDDYKFFGGDGFLKVTAALAASGAAGVKIASLATENPLGVMLSGANTFTGALRVDHSVAILDSAGALPTTTNPAVTLSNDAYLGFTENYAPSGTPATFAAFLAKISAGTLTAPGGSFLGLDAGTSGATRAFSGPIDLSTAPSGVILATATKADLSGTITAGSGGTLSLSGVRDGQLKISSALTPANGIGTVAVNSGDTRMVERGAVELASGLSTYAGGTRLYAGALLIGADSTLTSGPLGTGTLTIDGSAYFPLLAATGTRTLANPIQIQSYDLQLGVPVTTDSSTTAYRLQSYVATSLTLNGVISSPRITGAGNLFIGGSGTLTLNGANTFVHQVLIDGPNPTVNVGHNTGLGTGGLGIFTPGTVNFLTSAPVIGTLYGTGYGAESASRLNLATGSVLTINQNFDGVFSGVIAGTGASLLKNGGSKLVLSGANTYTGGTTINAGTLALFSNTAAGTGPITLNGGQLAVADGVTLANPIAFGAGGGRLVGNSTFTAPITVGAKTTLAPGNSPGTMTFASGLTWATGGAFDLEVQQAAGGAGAGYDTINVTGALTLTAIPSGQFNLNLLSLTSSSTAGAVADFSSASPYVWQIATATATITTFNAAAFNLNLSGFSNPLGGGSFSLSLGSVNSGTNNALLLNFTPVPEPATWALLALGLAPLALAARRRRP